MSQGKFSIKTYEDTGKAAGKLLSVMHTNHTIFWLTLAKNTHPQVFQRAIFIITLVLACITNQIYYNLWTFIFGSLTSFNGIFGFINMLMFVTTGYIIGFEGGFYYAKYIREIVSTKEIIDDLPKILKQFTYEVETISKPIKSDNELDKKSL
jgi:hypothetical protein